MQMDVCSHRLLALSLLSWPYLSTCSLRQNTEPDEENQPHHRTMEFFLETFRRCAVFHWWWLETTYPLIVRC
ncbi:hypothetical protein B0I35DRAFT_421684, partial [Stachybotrys elegans]